MLAPDLPAFTGSSSPCRKGIEPTATLSAEELRKVPQSAASFCMFIGEDRKLGSLLG
jgi:hypothetical protein